MLRTILHITVLLSALIWIIPATAQSVRPLTAQSVRSLTAQAVRSPTPQAVPRLTLQSDKLVQRIFLIGDAGQQKDGYQPVCDWLKVHVDWNDSSNVMVCLGDNSYPKALDDQVSVVAGKKARAFFIPGNHDSYLSSLNLPNVELLPKGGCPGPVIVPLGDKVVLVGMDSQWWLQDPSDRPGLESACDCKDERSILNALKDIIGLYPDKLIVLAMHHPLYTHGGHRGYFSTNPKYAELREQVEAVIRGHNNIVDVAGHDHTLQLLRHDSVTYVLSGAGSKPGFAMIEMHAGGQPVIRLYTIDSTNNLDHSFYSTQLPALPPPIDVAVTVPAFPDSVTVAADPEFHAGGLKQLLLGHNYRKEWAAPVKVKVFDMTGWTPVERGGGNQTRSLRIINAQGTSYVLRGVKKYVTGNTLPVALQGDQFAMDLITDGVSASYPYACLSVPPLATALGVPHAEPTMVYIPDDPRLGRFREDYANMFAFLEEREPGNGKKTYNMYDLEIMLKKDNDYLIDQRAALRARLLDMFVMDFDRHEDQWRWEETDDGKEKMLAPVPRDRDQVFFINQGVLPYIAGSPWALPQVQGFRAKARNILTYNLVARNFDRNYLNELTAQDWSAATDLALSSLTDSLIVASLRLQPASIRGPGYSEDKIIGILKARRSHFKEEMMRYYRFLARSVSIYGSDKREMFDVERKGEDTVIVTEHRIGKDGSVGRIVYSRVFLAGETKEIRIYGQGGDDQFHIHGENGGRIVVRIDGGAGDDRYQADAAAPAGKTKLYDVSTEKNTFTGQGGYRTFLSKDPSINTVDKLGYKYNVLQPMLNGGYNLDDGVLLGIGFRYTTQGFHKLPYKTLQQLTVDHSLSTKAYLFKYTFEAIEAVGKLDFLVHADVRSPSNTVNFFGFGNETGYNKQEKDGIRYYRARFDSYDFDGMLRRRWGRLLSVAAGPAFQYYRLDSADNYDRFINQTNLNGLDEATLYKDKAYAGGRARVTLDNRDSKILPSRGIYWNTTFGSYGGLNTYSHAYSKLSSDFAFYASFDPRGNVVIANRAGWGKSFGTYDFYNAQFLGATEDLRGYRKYRFAGNEAAYNNTDLRIKITDFRSYLFPARLGLVIFHDIGRVWYQQEHSNTWHEGYGAGLWLAPLNRVVIQAAYMRSVEGGLPLINLGFTF
jgi:hypothetical protein